MAGFWQKTKSINNFAEIFNNQIMKIRNFLGLAMVGLIAIAMISSCGGGKNGTTNDNSVGPAEPAQSFVPTAEQMAAGEKIFLEKCKVCHQPDGKGLKPAFPPLAGSDYLLSDKKRAVAQALNGSNMEIIVNGIAYKGLMPPQVATHEEAVNVINYVLNSFGNNGGYIGIDEVKEVVINPR